MAPHALNPEGPSIAAPVVGPSGHRPLKVIVIGAGIAGLSAAVGLRRAGHDVEIFEQSSFANEIGAAIHVCPNASRVLLGWGLDPSKQRFDVTKSALIAQANTLAPIHESDYGHIVVRYSAPWYLAHRVDLHNALQDLVTQSFGKGHPTNINLRSKVIAIDSHNATISLADGKSHQADLIIAADGVHSSAVKQVIGHHIPAQPTGQSAFRFLIPTEDILADEQTKHFLDGKDGKFKIFVGAGGRRVVWYPCRDGTLQNFVALHPDSEQHASVEEWNISAKTSDVLEEFQSFHPDLIATIKKATDVKLWKLLYREPIPSWHRDRLLLIGDAAHPMLPHQGQAGAQSIEDGAAIGVLLSGLKPSASADLAADIEKRLVAFETVRRKRASVMQIFSNAGQDEADKIRDEAARLLGDGIKVPSNQGEFHEFNFGYDVLGESEKVLRTIVD